MSMESQVRTVSDSGQFRGRVVRNDDPRGEGRVRRCHRQQ